MKTWRYILTGAAVLASLVIFFAISFAESEHGENDIKLLKDAAAALQASNPDMANRLLEHADRESKEIGGLSEEKVEKEERSEKREAREERRADLK